ncbi:hypothetical protein EZV62_011969 [Acer yangbiense]|uniref:Uncharacterized protein n=1 Tax=Acer yangbiense TaxID=1000413 RepID=A0A5C7I745_9ROSI|nr:hypothetical protein EZV62_011969 [Acer yangbiense]
MINCEKLIKMVRKPQRQAAMGRVERISLPRATAEVDVESYSKASLAEKGHFVIYTFDRKQEFGLSSDEPITLPCDAAFMTYIVSQIKLGAAKGTDESLDGSVADIGHFVVYTTDKTKVHGSLGIPWNISAELSSLSCLELQRKSMVSQAMELSHCHMYVIEPRHNLQQLGLNRCNFASVGTGPVQNLTGHIVFEVICSAWSMDFVDHMISAKGFTTGRYVKEALFDLDETGILDGRIITLVDEKNSSKKSLKDLKDFLIMAADGTLYHNKGKQMSSDPLKELFLVLRRDQMKPAQIASNDPYEAAGFYIGFLRTPDIRKMRTIYVKEALFDLDETGILDGRIITHVDEKNSSKKSLKDLKDFLIMAANVTLYHNEGKRTPEYFESVVEGMAFSLVGLKLQVILDRSFFGLLAL